MQGKNLFGQPKTYTVSFDQYRTFQESCFARRVDSENEWFGTKGETLPLPTYIIDIWSQRCDEIMQEILK